MSVSSAPGAEVPRAAVDVDAAARARYERQAAALDLTDAEQAGCRSVSRETDLAAELYDRADRHRRIAERLEAGDASAVLDVETIQHASPAG